MSHRGHFVGRMMAQRLGLRPRTFRIGATPEIWTGVCSCGWPDLEIRVWGGSAIVDCQCGRGKNPETKRLLRLFGKVYDLLGDDQHEDEYRRTYDHKCWEHSFVYGVTDIYVIPSYPGLTEEELEEMRFPDGLPREKCLFYFVWDDVPPDGISLTWALDLRKGTGSWRAAYDACRIAARSLHIRFPEEAISLPDT